MSTKRQHGQYYTRKSPFNTPLFHGWFERARKSSNNTVVEPFAGSGCIKDMLQSKIQNWALYDLEPSAPEIIQQDTLAEFPTGFDICITNPPYIAKNSAKRMGLPYPKEAEKYIDLYLYSLDRILANCGFCAAIIPASFLTRNLFVDRLLAIDIVTTNLFDDTDVPVCVAYFVPVGSSEVSKGSFLIYQDGERIDYLSTLKRKIVKPKSKGDWTFNDPEGWLGLYAVDGTTGSKIRFVDGNDIASENIVHSSRSITRISGPSVDIALLNHVLEEYRKDTSDVFLTTFKGKRSDGHYRRRLDFANTRRLLNVALDIMNEKGGTDAEIV